MSCQAVAEFITLSNVPPFQLKVFVAPVKEVPFMTFNVPAVRVTPPVKVLAEKSVNAPVVFTVSAPVPVSTPWMKP